MLSHVAPVSEGQQDELLFTPKTNRRKEGCPLGTPVLIVTGLLDICIYSIHIYVCVCIYILSELIYNLLKDVTTVNIYCRQILFFKT